MKVFAVIPVHNRLEETRQVVACLRQQTHAPIEIVIVDDGSTDGTAAWLAGERDITTLTGDGNLWWGGAVARGLDSVLRRATDADYVLLVNNDITFGADFVATLVRVSLENRHAVVGGILRELGNTDNVLGLGPVVDVWTMRVWERYNTLDETERKNLKPVYEVDALSGRGTLYPVRCFRVGGRLYPRLLPHYYADYELAMRMRRHGFALLVSTQADVLSRNDFSVQPKQRPTWFQTYFGERSHLNVFRRIAFFSLVGTPWERITAIPRMTKFALERAMAQLKQRLA